MRSIRFRAEVFLTFFLLVIFNLLSPGTSEAANATVTATGYALYTECLNPEASTPCTVTQDVPIKHAKVVMCDNDGAAGCEIMATGWTDESGYFNITGTGGDWDVFCIGDLACGLPDPLVYVEADSNVAVVRKPLASTLDPTFPTYCFKSYTKVNIPSGPEDFGNVMPGNGLKCQSEPVSAAGEDGAWHIFTKLYEANTFMWSRTPAMNIPKVSAFWPDWDNQNFYRPPILFWGGAISLEASSAWNEATIVHEYGHHIVTHYTNSGLVLWTFPALYQNGQCDPSHCAWEPENPPIAFFEGWPTFISSMVGRHYDYNNVYDLETHRDLTVDSLGVPVSFAGREDNIENFNAAILWDLYDTVDDDQHADGAGRRDASSIGINCMWNALVNSGSGAPSTSIHELWNGLKAGTCGGRSNWISEIYREHHIVKPQPDVASYLSSEPPASGNSGTSFLVAGSVYNHGDEATNIAFTNRYYLSIDTVLDALDRAVGEHVVTPLNAGASYALQISALIPGSLPTGYYYLIVCADADGEVPESNEGNNCRVSSSGMQVTSSSINICFTDDDSDGYQAYAPTWRRVPCGYLFEADCNDTNASVHPNAAEVCNGVNDDCDGLTDEGLTNTYYRDEDADGYGDPAVTTQACSTPAGYVANNADCNDSNDRINPGSLEICDGVDNNCDGQVDEPGASVIAGPIINPSNGHTYYAIANNSWTGAEAGAQLLGGHLVTINDNAENSWIWETFAPVVGGGLWIGLSDAAQEDSFVWANGEPASYFNWWCRSQTDCEPSNSGGAEHYVEMNNYVWNDNINGQFLVGIVEVAEICDGADNDCDGQIDEGVTNTYYRDADADGYGNPAVTAPACSLPAGYVTNNTDCNDNSAAAHPGATEGPSGNATCSDSVDNDCDGLTDAADSNCQAANVDLAVTAVTGPTTGLPGATITIGDTTKNNGPSNAQESTTKFYWSTNSTLDAADAYLGARAIPALAALASNKGTITVTVPANACAGTFYIIAKADADNLIAETNEANNTKSKTIKTGADLVVFTVTTSPAASGAGKTLTITDTTKNSGGCPAGASTTKLYLSTNSKWDAGDTYLGERAVPALAAGATNAGPTVVTIPAGTATGSYSIIAKADANAVVTETSETNNTKAKAIKIGPDLIVSLITAPTSAVRGTAILITDTTKNSGGGDAGESTTKLYLSTNNTYDAADVYLGQRAVPNIAAGATNAGPTAVTIPAGTTPGAYYIIAVSDANAVVVETSETNNNKSKLITINP